VRDFSLIERQSSANVAGPDYAPAKRASDS
jgi:hypothetical protein